MSLIADSLKKAVKEKSVPQWDPSQEINLVGKRDPLKHPGLWSVFRIGLLIILPTAILVYLIATGAFDFNNRQTSLLPETAKAPLDSRVSPKSPNEKTLKATPAESFSKPQAKEAPVLEEKAVVSETLPSPGKKGTVHKKVLPSYPPKKKAIKNLEQAIATPQDEIVSLLPKSELKATGRETATVAPPEVPAIGLDGEAVVLEKKAVVPEVPSAPEPVEEKIPQSASAKKTEITSKPAKEALLEEIQSPLSPTVIPEIVSVEKEKKSPNRTIEAPKDERQVASLPAPRSKPEITRTEPVRQENVFQNSDYYFNRAVFFQQAKDWQKALDNYVKAEKLDPNNPDTYNNKGVIYKELGQYDRALDEFLRVIFLNPQYAKAYNNIGVVYFMQKNYAEAIRNYLKAIDLNTSNLEAFNNLAIIYKKQKDLEKARSVLNQALSMDPDHPGTNYNLAVLYEENKEITSALHYYRRFIELGTISYPALVAQVKKHVETLKPQ